MYIYSHLILGGTFDHFHAGHRRFIEKGAEIARQMTIGIVSQKMLSKKILFQATEGYKQRKTSVREFLSKKGWLEKTTIVPLTDIYGIGKSARNIDAVLATKVTYPNALKINDLRRKLGMNRLAIEGVDFVMADDGKPITSERIRMGEIDRQGKSYLKIFSNKILELPDSLRPVLREPIGPLVKLSASLVGLIKKEKPVMLIAVGDIISLRLLRDKHPPDVMIIDYRSRRAPIKDFHGLLADSHGYPCKSVFQNPCESVINKAGTINSTAVKAIYTAINKYLTKSIKGTVVIDGEEDLLALPAILLAPLNSLVIYGQLDEGVVFVRVTESEKKRIKSIISKFS